jgi:hypothetical protein
LPPIFTNFSRSVASDPCSTDFARQNTRKRELPSDLRGLLPRRVGQDYRVVGNDIVLIETATNVILDVMQGALR